MIGFTSLCRSVQAANTSAAAAGRVCQAAGQVCGTWEKVPSGDGIHRTRKEWQLCVKTFADSGGTIWERAIQVTFKCWSKCQNKGRLSSLRILQYNAILGQYLICTAFGLISMQFSFISIAPLGKHFRINQSNFYSANIPGEARLSGTTAKSVFNSKI